MCSCSRAGNLLCCVGLSTSRQSHGCFAMNLFCTWVVNLVLLGGIGKEQLHCVWEAVTRQRLPVPTWTSLGAEWGMWVLTKNRDQAELKSQTQPPKYTLGTVLWLWVWDCCGITPSWLLGTVAQKHWMTWSDTGNFKDPGAAPFINVSVWCFTIKPRLFSEQFSQGLALCFVDFYCNEVDLKIMTFFFWRCDSSRGEALHMCRWRNENVQPENRCLFYHIFCFA